MTCVLRDGPLSWNMTRDEEGHREYKVRWLIACDPTDGPANAIQTFGLPQPGDYWIIDDDIDLYAWCRWGATVTPKVDNEKNTFFVVENTFSTKPGKRCNETQIEDPLLEPPKISGGFVKQAEEATFDRFGNPIQNSAHEQIRGPQVEFEASRPTVRIEQNVIALELELITPMVDAVNDAPLWGHPPRTVKLTNFSWERKFHGLCNVYFTRTFEFEVNPRTFDRDILDEGTRVLHGHWADDGATWVLDDIDGEAPDPENPTHFDKAKDRNGENMRVILDGQGRPATSRGLVIDGIIWDTGDTMEVHTVDPHGLAVDDEITIVGVRPPFYDGDYVVREIVNANAFMVDVPMEDLPAYESDGIVSVGGASVGNVHVEKFAPANFLLLGIPLVLE